MLFYKAQNKDLSRINKRLHQTVVYCMYIFKWRIGVLGI